MELLVISEEEVINLDQVVKCTRAQRLPDVTLHFADGTQRTFCIAREADIIWRMFWKGTDSLMQRVEAFERSLSQRPDADIPF